MKKKENIRTIFLIVFSFVMGGIIMFALLKWTPLVSEVLGTNGNTIITKNGTQVYEKNSLAAAVDKIYDAVAMVSSYQNNTLVSTGSAFVYKTDNNYGYLYPLLEKYDMKAVISIVGSYTDKFSETDEANLNYSYLRWKDINELISSGRVEFQNHTYNLHDNTHGRIGAKKKKGESDDEYKKILEEDINKLQNEFKENTGYVPTCFTYPFGGISNSSLDIIKELGFKASLSCEEGINKITKNPNSLYLLKRYNRPSYVSTYNIFKKFN